ncbi:hypothetical protein HRED_03659 [Candidatus Haloredivivus sp. G17]|nr:hypothetical protein HRED_03659 [Candidatus Haloredivivus sp. G17]
MTSDEDFLKTIVISLSLSRLISLLSGKYPSFDESDFKALIDEVENQDDQIDEIREGYVELGEMMQLVLEELKN